MYIPATSNLRQHFEVLTLPEYFDLIGRREPERVNQNEFRLQCIHPQCRAKRKGYWFRVVKNVTSTYRSVRRHVQNFHEEPEQEPELAEQLPEEGEVDENNNQDVK